MFKHNHAHTKKYSKIKILVIITLVVIFSSYILLQHPRNQYTHSSKKLSQRTIKKQQSTQTSNTATSSSRPNGPEYQMRIGPLADPNDTPPTQTGWVNPNGGGYYVGEGPFDVTDSNGEHHWVDPQTAGWTKMTYSNTKETYDDSGN